MTIQSKVGVNKSLEIFWTFSSCITYSKKISRAYTDCLLFAYGTWIAMAVFKGSLVLQSP